MYNIKDKLPPENKFVKIFMKDEVLEHREFDDEMFYIKGKLKSKDDISFHIINSLGSEIKLKDGCYTVMGWEELNG